MKKNYYLTMLFIMLAFPIMLTGQQYNAMYRLTNFEQVNETYLEFDLELHNTGTFAFGLDNMQCRINFNPAIYSGQSLTSQARGRGATPKSTGLVGWYGDTSGGSNEPSLSNKVTTAFNTNISGVVLGYIIVSTGILPDDQKIDLIPAGGFVNIARIKLLCNNGTTGSNIKYLPFAELMHNIAFDSNLGNHIVNRVVEYDATDPLNVYKVGATSAQTPVTNSTPVENLIPNTYLSGYCFNGTGDYSDITKWNNATSSTISGYHVVPSITNNAIISGNCTVATNVTASTLNINTGGKLTLNSLTSLSVANLNINSDASGNGTFVDKGGTLSATNTKVQQYVTKGRNWYMSSPIEVATPAMLASSKVVTYDETKAMWVDPVIEDLEVMKGYGAVTPTATGPVTFTGKLNTSAKSIDVSYTSTVAKSGFNLVGNPYPSYVNIFKATKINLLDSYWIRTKTSMNAYTFDTYNISGHTGTNNSGKALTDFIPPMQAFWVRANAVGASLGFDNTMREHQDVPTNLFRAPAKDDYQLLRLEVSNGTNSDQALVYSNENASDIYDRFDSPKYGNASPFIPEIYTLAGQEQVAINGFKEIPLDTEIPLGFTTGTNNSFTIKAIEAKNFNASTKIILIDKLLHVSQILTSDGVGYNFRSDVASDANRFSLMFKTASIATDFNTPKLNTDKFDVIAYGNANKQIVVNITNKFNEKALVAIYDVSGKKLVDNLITSNNMVISRGFKQGVYLVNVVNGGLTIIQKVILK